MGMSVRQRIGLIACALMAALICFVAYGSSTQNVKTQMEAGVDRASFPTPEDGDIVPGEVIVGLEEEATQADLTALNRQTDAQTEENLPRSDVNLVDLPQDVGVREAVQRYEASPAVEYAEPNFKIFPSATPNDPSFNKLWGLN